MFTFISVFLYLNNNHYKCHDSIYRVRIILFHAWRKTEFIQCYSVVGRQVNYATYLSPNKYHCVHHTQPRIPNIFGASYVCPSGLKEKQKWLNEKKEERERYVMVAWMTGTMKEMKERRTWQQWQIWHFIMHHRSLHQTSRSTISNFTLDFNQYLNCISLNFT